MPRREVAPGCRACCIDNAHLAKRIFTSGPRTVGFSVFWEVSTNTVLFDTFFVGLSESESRSACELLFRFSLNSYNHSYFDVFLVFFRISQLVEYNHELCRMELNVVVFVEAHS